MSFFEGQGPIWTPEEQENAHQSWDQSQEPDMSLLQQDESQEEPPIAFGSQYEEIARASDNLIKSGKTFDNAHSRHDSMPMMSNYPQRESHASMLAVASIDILPDPRAGGQQRHHSISDYDGMRSPQASQSPSNYQGYVSNQRFGPRPSEAEQMMQAKRRAAAQRERELRNYHQDQQYNRNLGGPKSDRSMSPGAMSEEDRRELIARQHRALYGNDSTLYPTDGSSPRSISQDARVVAAPGALGSASPLGYDTFGNTSTTAVEGGVPMSASVGPQRSRENSLSSSPNPANFTMFESSQQMQAPKQGSGSSSPKRQEGSAPSTGGVAPIGTRPVLGIGAGKRGTPPMPSPLSYGFSNEKNGQLATERSQSAASNSGHGNGEKGSNLGWNAANTAAWGPNKMQASVWG